MGYVTLNITMSINDELERIWNNTIITSEDNILRFACRD
jgi:hypothetical protein